MVEVLEIKKVDDLYKMTVKVTNKTESWMKQEAEVFEASIQDCATRLMFATWLETIAKQMRKSQAA